MQSLGSDPANRALASRHFRTCGRFLAALVLPLLGACARKDYSSEMDKVRSWTATTTLAADRRAAHATNAALTRQLRDRASKSYSSSKEELDKLANTDSRRVAARSALDSLQQGIRRLGGAAR